MVRIKASSLTETLVAIVLTGICTAMLFQFFPKTKQLAYPINKSQIVNRADSLLLELERGKEMQFPLSIEGITYDIAFSNITLNQGETSVNKVNITAFTSKGDLVLNQEKIISLEGK